MFLLINISAFGFKGNVYLHDIILWKIQLKKHSNRHHIFLSRTPTLGILIIKEILF